MGTGLTMSFKEMLESAWAATQQTAESLWAHLLAQSLWPNWAAYVVGIPSAMAVAYLIWRYLDDKKNSHRRFKELPFLGSVWRWSSLSDLPHALQPYCPNCQGLLVYEELGGRYGNQAQSVALHCEACQTIPTEQSGTWKYLQARVEREIQRLIRTGEWRQHVPGH